MYRIMEDWTDIRERVASGKVSKREILHDLHAHYDRQYGLAWENVARKSKILDWDGTSGRRSWSASSIRISLSLKRVSKFSAKLTLAEASSPR